MVTQTQGISETVAAFDDQETVSIPDHATDAIRVFKGIAHRLDI